MVVLMAVWLVGMLDMIKVSYLDGLLVHWMVDKRVAYLVFWLVEKLAERKEVLMGIA